MLKLYIIAGEASGDLHGANLIKEIKKQHSDVEIRCWGGDLMEAAGGKVVKHYRDLAFMGFFEVLMNIRTISGNLKFCKRDIEEYQPDAVIFIDYPGFNLRIAEHVKQLGVPSLYYISPQVWAWKESRVKKIKRVVDRMFVILPFEKEFYQKHQYEVEFVGHPLVDAIEQFKEQALTKEAFTSKYGLSDLPIVALLPGSRKQEISVKLPIMLSVVEEYPEYQFVIAGAPSQDKQFYKQFLVSSRIKLIENDTYNLLNNSHAALVTSGTATLETGLFQVPQVVCYKGSAISYHIAKRLVKIDYISLVNLIANKEVVKELIQGELTKDNLISELTGLLAGEKRETLLQDYQRMIGVLGGGGASEKTAKSMLKTIKELKSHNQ